MENLINIDTETESNAAVLDRDLSWLAAVLDVRFRLYFGQECEYDDIHDLLPPDYKEGASPFSDVILQYKLNASERLVLLLALTPYIRPQLLDIFYTKNATYDRGFTEFGGLKGNNHGGFLPTTETALFMLAGINTSRRFEAMKVFHPDARLMTSGLVRVLPPPADEPLSCGQLCPGREFLGQFTTGKIDKPDYSANFPARLVTTKLEWEDLILEEHVLDEVKEIRAWLKHERELMEDWGLHTVLKPGYRSLFFGPPGTGKTLTAMLLGKNTGLDVYRIDLSMIVSKYIGETEKNLANVFDQGLNHRWILFFDEADSLFGKRTSASSAHDRYANQEVSYLLQRIEDYPGVVILATNLKSNIDEAFARRFQNMIHFPMPGTEERLKLWKNVFSKSSKLDESVDMFKIASDHILSGGAIINVVRYCSLMAIERGSNVILAADIENGIKREFKKEGKIK
ncbi:MAG: ATP-binding protein [Bacteroidota bacterium]|nr:ATP-binding protein [Bacteroidota bacterium]